MVCDVDPVRSCESLEIKLSTIFLGKTVEIFENKQHFFSKLGPVTLPINKFVKGLFTLVPLKFFHLINNVEDIVVFLGLKVFNSNHFYIFSCSARQF